MNSSVMRCVIDRRMAHACSSVATDRGEKKHSLPLSRACGALSCFSCQTRCFGDSKRHVNPLKNVSRKKQRTEDRTISKSNTENLEFDA